MCTLRIRWRHERSGASFPKYRIYPVLNVPESGTADVGQIPCLSGRMEDADAGSVQTYRVQADSDAVESKLEQIPFHSRVLDSMEQGYER